MSEGTRPLTDAEILNTPVPANPVARLLALVQLLQATIRLGDVSLFEMWRRAEFRDGPDVSALIAPASPRATFERIAAAVALAAEAREFATTAMGGLPAFYERGFDAADRALERSDLNVPCSGISNNLEAARATLDFAVHLLEQKGVSVLVGREDLLALRRMADALVEAVLAADVDARLRDELVELSTTFRRRIEEAWFRGPRGIVRAFDELNGAAGRHSEALDRAPTVRARIMALAPTMLKVADIALRASSLFLQVSGATGPFSLLPPGTDLPSLEAPAPMRSLPPGPNVDV